MKFTLTLNLDGAAFDTDPALVTGSILVRLGEDLMEAGFTGVGREDSTGTIEATLRDGNGNRAGTWTVNP